MNKTVKIKIEGIRPLLMHNGQLADPLNERTRALKRAVEKKSKMTDSDHEHARRCEWLGGAYFAESVGFYLPSENIEAMIVAGAKKARKGKQALAAIMVDEEVVPLGLPQGCPSPRNYEAFMDDKSGRFELRVGVKVGQARVMRTRPKFPSGWTLEFDLCFDETVLNLADIIEAVQAAGQYVGIGDWRPKFGRFQLVAVDGKEVA